MARRVLGMKLKWCLSLGFSGKTMFKFTKYKIKTFVQKCIINVLVMLWKAELEISI